MYNNYIFDLYGTLVDIRTDEVKDELWEKMSIFYSFYGAKYDPDDFRTKYFKYIEKMAEVSGNPDIIEIDLEDIFFQLFKKKKVKPKKKVVREAARIFRLLSLEKLELYPYTLQVLEELKKKGKKLFLLTNAQACFTRNELVALDLNEIFDEIYISSELGIKKPNVDSYKKVIEDNKLNPKKTIMIGNEYSTDIEGANRAGIDSVFVKSNIQHKDAKKVPSTFTIEDGDLRKIIELTVKK
jgi:putative hydrolase of the HAD superfamily